LDGQNNARAYLTPQPSFLAQGIALETAFKNDLLNNPEVAVRLYTDQSVIDAKVAEVLAIVQHAGIYKLAFVSVEQ
jgi:biopolymer transport protein TolR